MSFFTFQNTTVMKNKISLLTALFGLFLFTAGCLKNEPLPQPEALPVLPEQVYEYELKDLPEHMAGDFLFGNSNDVINTDPNFIPEFSGEFRTHNPAITNDGATLGRVIFYDKRLSINNAVACASCHLQERAFSDPVAGSEGFKGKITPRNSMAIVNVALNRNLFWDSRVHSAKELALKPVQNHIEMGMESMEILEKKLASLDYYPPLFQKAFGSGEVTADRISDALAMFLCSMVSVNSKFDEGIAQSFQNYNALEKMGKDLFFSNQTKCVQCHSGNNFAAPDSPGGEYGSREVAGTANTGLDLSPEDEGLGDGKFRIPSLRNIALTAPYMHDGRFETLEEVIEFYNSGIKGHPGLDPKLVAEDGEPMRMHLTDLEKKALLAFLNTLTDQSLMTDVRFSNPF